MKPKIIAFYLPQFHAIPENDNWWGRGFTEWTNVKKAKPLFSPHYQPRVPLNKNYYDLSDPKTMDWQFNLAKNYGIYGFCFYHYWFKGKKLLEQPVEQAFAYGRLTMPFCFSWANESWSRTWYGSNNEILLAQNYGEKEDWKKHYLYLEKFFKNENYIKIDNMPILLIYKPSQIKNLDLIIQEWDQLARASGFDGMYIIESLTPSQNQPTSNLSRGFVYYEPGYSIYNDSFMRKLIVKFKANINGLFKSKVLLNKISFDKIYSDIIKRKNRNINKAEFYGCFVDYDDSSRKDYQGIIMKNGSPEKLEKYLKSLIKKSKSLNSKYLFLTAWNEWAEGAYLEPDERNKYGFLEAVKKAQEM